MALEADTKPVDLDESSLTVNGDSSDTIQIKLVPEQREARKLYTRLLVRRLYDVNTVNQSFSTHLVIKFAWPVPKNENPPDPYDDDGDWEPEWTPKYRIKNMLSEDFTVAQYSTYVDEASGQRMIRADLEHIVTLHETLELEHFPVDCQNLSIIIENKMEDKYCVWVPFPNCAMINVMLENVSLNDFQLLNRGRDIKPFSFRAYDYKIDRRLSKRTANALETKIKLERKTFYYAVNVALVTFMISTLCLTAYTIHPGDIPSRSGIDLTLILTAVAFKHVSAGMLPPVSYVTMLDVYILSCMLFLMAVTICHAVLPRFYFSKNEDSVLTHPADYFPNELGLIKGDELSLVVFSVVWGLFNIGYVLLVIIKKRKERDLFMAEAKEESQTQWMWSSTSTRHLGAPDERSSKDMAR